MFKFAVSNLLSRPARSLLSLTGLTVAISGMVGLFSVAEGLDATVSTTFGRLPGLVAMQPGAPIPLFSRLPAAWGDEIAHVPGVAHVNAEVWQRVHVINRKMIVSPPRFFFGTDIPSRLKLKQGVYREDMVAGRFLSESDRGTRNCLVSQAIADEFAKDVGDRLTVNGYELEIVGLYKTGSQLLDVAIILDIDQVRQMTRFSADSVSAYYIEQAGDVDDDELAHRIQNVFRDRPSEVWRPSSLMALANAATSDSSPTQSLTDLLRDWDTRLKQFGQQQASGADTLDDSTSQHSSSNAVAGAEPIPEKGSPDRHSPEKRVAAAPQSKVELSREELVEDELPIEVRSATDWASRFDQFSEDLELFLTLLTAIGVTIAVLSIVNTMLMSVTERITEFGILKANGWTNRNIVQLITFESGVLGVCGGALGAILGWVATQIVNWNWPNHVQLFASPSLLTFSIVFSTLLGVAGGIYPAVWATRLQPVEAIRRG